MLESNAKNPDLRILGIIPARGGSKGVPRKNIKLLGSKPLIAYSIQSSLESRELQEICVSTEDAEIAKISQQYGAKVPFIRPAYLATDSSPSIDTVIHAVQFYQKQGQIFDALCLLQATCPFRTAGDIQQSILTFKKSGADSLISVRKVPHEYNPHWTFKENKNGFLRIATGEKSIIPRRQELPPAYHRDGSIYIVKTKILLEQKSLYGEKIAFHVSQNPIHINIDTMQDWEKAEKLLQDKQANT